MDSKLFIGNLNTELDFAFQNLLLKSEMERLKIHSDFAAFYFNDYEQIVDILKAETLDNPYSSDMQKKIVFQHEDIIKKITARITSGIYTNRPVRKYIDDESASFILTEILEFLKYPKIVKDAFRKSTFFNTVLVGVIGEIGAGATRLEVITPDHFIVATKANHKEMKELIIRKADENNNIYYSVWTEKEHYTQYAGGARLNTMKNPFGIIPYAVLRMEDGQDFYGEPNWSLFLAQKSRDIRLTDLDQGELKEIHGIWFGVNTDFKSSDRFAPGTIHQVVNNDSSREVSLTQVTSNIDWDAIRENMDKRLQTLMMSEGISSNSASTETKAESGAAKVIDELETLERREETKETLYEFELSLMKIIEIVQNTYSQKKISTGRRDVIFVEDKPYESIQDKIARREHEQQVGYYDNVDFTMQDLEISEIEAIQLLEKKAKRNLNENSDV